MDEQQWKKVNEIVDTALELEEPERSTFIEEKCSDDEQLKFRVTELLESIEKSDAEGFLEQEQYPKHLMADLSETSGKFPDKDSSLVGQTIDQYHITELIDHGGMGSVYLAERADEAYEQTVAFKVIRRGMDTPSNIARFKRERQILASLEHPNIARLLDGGMTSNRLPYLVLEYIEGIPLYEYCDEQKLSIEERLQLFRSICAGVQYAHKNAVIHRDLKPSNIFVTADGTVKILDFGIAKLMKAEDPDTTLYQTREGARLLTLGYAAPEQVESNPITTATDIYTLGILLYELLSGVHPFNLPKKDLTEIEKIIRQQTPSNPSGQYRKLSEAKQKEIARQRGTEPSALTKDLEGDLDAIVMKTLRKEPETRYDSVGQMLEDFERRQDDRPIIAREDTFRYKASKFLRRYKTPIVTAAGILLLVAALTGYYSWQLKQQRDIARTEAAKAERTTDFLVDLFSASNPAESRGEIIPVRTILEEGLQEIRQLREQPEIQSQMMQTIGKVYTNLGKYEKAEKLLRRSLEIHKNLSRQHAAVASIYNDLAVLHHKAQELEQAEPYYARALDIRKNIGDRNPLDYAETLNDLGALMRFKGKLDSSRALHSEALSIRRNNLDPNHPEIATSLNNLGVLHDSKGNLDKAREYYEEALQIRRNHFGNDHPKIANVMNNLAVLYRNMGKFDEAENYYAQTLEIRRSIYGESHPSTAQSLNNFAGFLTDKGDLGRAETYYRRALDIRKDLLGPSHIQTGTAYNNLANVLFEQSLLDSAKIAYRKAIEIYASSLAEDHRYVGIVQSNLGKVLTAKQEYESATRVFDEAQSILHASYNSPNISVANLYSYRAQLEMKKEDLTKAMELLEDALSIRNELQSSEHPEFKEDIDRLSKIYQQLGDKPRSDSLKNVLLPE